MRNGIVPVVAPRSRRDMESLAENFLRRHFPDHLTVPGKLNVTEFLEVLQDSYELDVSITNLPAGIEGRTWPSGLIEIDEATYRAAVFGDGRARHTIPHEGAHGLFHLVEIQVAATKGCVPLYRQMDVPPFRDPEWQADAFAGALLMPADMMIELAARARRSCGYFVSVTDLVRRTFGVSQRAAETRLSILSRTHGLK